MTSCKLIYHLDRLQKWLDGEHFPPIHIDLGITTGCNAKCKFCYGQFIGQTPLKNAYHMDKSIAFKLFNESKVAGIKSITLIGEGENTIHPDFYDIINFGKSIGMDLAIATNGIFIKKEKMKEFLEAFTWVRISLCASNKDLYKKIHGVNQFNAVWENIKELVKIKKKYKLDTTIGVQMVVIKDNISDIENMARFCKYLGVDYLVIKPCADTPDKKFKIPFSRLKKLNAEFKKAEAHSTDMYDVIIKRNKFKAGNKHPFKVCYATPFAISMDAHGNVAPCGHLLGYKSKEFNMGNIHNQSMTEIINSEKYWNIHKKVESLDLDKECETNCMQWNMCVFLDGIKKRPSHLNFP